MADLSPDKCVICRKDSSQKLWPVQAKGINSLKNASENRKDNDLRAYLELDTSVILVHESCRKWFTNKRELKSISVGVCSDDGEKSSKTLRSGALKFNWKEMCFFCSESVSVDTNPTERRRVETFEIRKSTL